LIILCILIIPTYLYVGNALNERTERMHPITQPSTVWQSEDGRITFIIPDNIGAIPVTVETVSGFVEIEMLIVQKSTSIAFVKNSELTNPGTKYQMLAGGDGLPKAYDKFVIEISTIYTDDSIFEPGEKIVFHKISTPEPEETETMSKTGDG